MNASLQDAVGAGGCQCGKPAPREAVRPYRNNRPGRSHPASAAQKAQAAGRTLAAGAALARRHLTDGRVRAHATHRTPS